MSSVKLNDVAVSSSRYERDHGALPRGTGSWAFCATAHYDRVDYLEHVFWVHNVRFSDAKKVARAHFAAAGVADVVVCS